MACHAVASKLIGPSFKEIAAKYAGQADVVPKLTEKVIKGGAGVWGAVPMPAESSGHRGRGEAARAVDIDDQVTPSIT